MKVRTLYRTRRPVVEIEFSRQDYIIFRIQGDGKWYNGVESLAVDYEAKALKLTLLDGTTVYLSPKHELTI